MNLPNKLTCLRIMMIPVFVLFMYLGDGFRIWALIIFVLASITDTLDGNIARKYNMVTDFGKIMDPLADKILVLAALICLMEFGEIPGWTIIVILAREFTISGMRTVAARDGIVIAAGASGKVKTTLQMISLVILLLKDWPFTYFTSIPVGLILYYASVFMTLYSGVEYIIKNRNIIIGKEI